MASNATWKNNFPLFEWEIGHLSAHIGRVLNRLALIHLKKLLYAIYTHSYNKLRGLKSMNGLPTVLSVSGHFVLM